MPICIQATNVSECTSDTFAAKIQIGNKHTYLYNENRPLE